MPRCDVCARGAWFRIGRLHVTRTATAAIIPAAFVATLTARDLLDIVAGRASDPATVLRTLRVAVPVTSCCLFWFALLLFHIDHEKRRWAAAGQLLLALFLLAYAAEIRPALSAIRAGADPHPRVPALKAAQQCDRR